jgi:AraC family transcriptional activator of pobA
LRPKPSISWKDAHSVIEPQITADSVHVWPFDGAFPIDVRFLAFHPTRNIRPNRHDYFEALYVHSGVVEYEVQGATCKLRQGDLFVMGGTLLHRMSRISAPQVKAVVLYFLPEMILAGEPGGEDVSYLMPFLAQDEGFPHVVPAETGLPEQVFDLMKRTAGELPATTNRARLSVRTYLKMILVLLVNHYAEYRGGEEKFLIRQRDLKRLDPVFGLIGEGYAGAITVDDAAQAIGMSRSAFMRFFKKVTGQSFVTYLHHFRVAKAESLLAATDLSVAEVSQSVGFCDQSYFGLVFREMTGLTPRQFKELSGNSRKEALPTHR